MRENGTLRIKKVRSIEPFNKERKFIIKRIIKIEEMPFTYCVYRYEKPTVHSLLKDTLRNARDILWGGPDYYNEECAYNQVYP